MAKRFKRSYRRRFRRTRGYRKRRFTRKGSMFKRIKKLEKVAIKERPCKRWLISDQGVTGGNQSGFLGSVLANSNPLGQVWGLMQRGTALQLRDADDVYWSKIQMKCTTITTQNSEVNVRWYLGVMKDASGGGFSTLAFCQDYFGVSQPNINSIPNISNRNVKSRYRILKTGHFKMKPTLSSQVMRHDWTMKWFSKNHVHTSYCRDNTGSSVDIDSGLIFFFMMTDSQITTSAGIQTLMEGNMWFRDQV